MRASAAGFYLLLAAMGAIVPSIILPWCAEHGVSPALFGSAFANRPAAMFSTDVLLCCAVFLVWAEIETRRLRMGAR